MCEKYLEYETKLIHLQLMRSTPAGAGKTKKEPRTQCYRSDHPRRCGENPNQFIKHIQSQGSPPQVRGKPRSISGNRHTDRITPAGAGKTPSLHVYAHGF